MPVPGIPLENTMILEFRVICYDPETLQLGLMVIRGRVDEVVGGTMTDRDAAERLDTVIHGDMKNLLADDCYYYGVGCKILNLVPPPLEKLTIAHQGPGVVTSPTLPGQLTGLITLNTPVAGPAGRGRKYVPFVPFSDVDVNNKVGAAYHANLEALGLHFAGPMYVGAIGFSAVVTFGLTGPTLAHFYPFMGRSASWYLATQRRRGAYGKTNVLPNPL